MSDAKENTPFGITRDEILSLAAQKLADEFADHENISETVNRLVAQRIKESVDSNFTGKIDAFLSAEMERLLRSDVTPVNIWGETVGKPTSIRDSLAARALVFWNETVDRDGKTSSSYGGKKRHEWLFSKIVNEEFASVVKQNLVNMLGAFKEAMREDAKKKIDDYLEALIKVKSK